MTRRSLVDGTLANKVMRDVLREQAAFHRAELSVRITPDLKGRLDALCQKLGRPRMSLVREAIERWVNWKEATTL